LKNAAAHSWHYISIQFLFISLVTERLKVENANNNNNKANFLHEIIFHRFMIFFIHHGCAVMFLVLRGVPWGGGGGTAAPGSRVQKAENGWENEYNFLRSRK
jgi:hypothetical protein